MRIFVGFGYNERDKWIEDRLFPILQCADFTVVHGKDMHGLVLDSEVKRRLEQSDAVVGFFTIRDGQGEADFNSHIWVRDELLHASAIGKPIVPVKEIGARIPDGLLGNRQYIPLDRNDRLACASEIMRALGQRRMRRIRLEPEDELKMSIWQWKRQQGFVVRYRTQTADGFESPYRDGRLELIDQGFYVNLLDIPSRAYIEVEGMLNGNPLFSSGWVSADAVQIKVF